MIWRYADAVRDEAAYTASMDRRARAARLEREEHYLGECPICGKAMYDDEFEYTTKVIEEDEFFGDHVHQCCLEFWKEDRKALA